MTQKYFSHSGTPVEWAALCEVSYKGIPVLGGDPYKLNFMALFTILGF